MTPAALLARLRADGFSLRVEAGKLKLSPISKLAGELKDAVIAQRDALLALLGAGLSDADIDALAAFMADEPPAESVALLRAVILTWPCGTKLALSEQALAEWDAQSAECRRLPPARYRPGRSESDLFTQDPEET